MNKDIEIKITGSYFQIDNEGYLINPTSKDKLQNKWKPIVDDIIEGYKKSYGSFLKSVHIRGSVAKGEAVEDISDVDSFAYVDLPTEEISHEWKDSFIKEIVRKYPFSNGVELLVLPSENTSKNMKVLLNQSLLVYGEPQEVQKMKIDKELAIHAVDIEGRINRTRKVLEETEEKQELEDHCVWAMKGLVRIGLEIWLEKSNKYSRDLYRCYEVFSEYYPEKEPQMKEVLILALNPTSDKKVIKRVIEDFGGWLSEETKKVI